ncbi:MAG: hypothetical protein QNJ31_01125 [Candidatus Caenarcaniphilales bacterium]|nr:hypothetical protein [Candidatus Caenarcaniphilales bacterium]
MSREFGKKLVLFAYTKAENIEGFVKSFLDKNPKFSTLILFLILLGVAPLFSQCITRTNTYLESLTSKKIKTILKDGRRMNEAGKIKGALLQYQKAFFLRPTEFASNLELSLFYLKHNNFSLLQKHIEFLKLLYPDKIRVQALTAIDNLYQGSYANAEEGLKLVKSLGLNDDWVIEAYAISLIANKKTQSASKLAGWPNDCEANSVSHSLCMKRIANWHSEVKEIKNRMQKCPIGSKNELHYHKERELIYLGESLRSLRRAIESETDGFYKLYLIKDYFYTKDNLKKIHSRFSRDKYLDENNAAHTQLTQKERSFKI